MGVLEKIALSITKDAIGGYLDKKPGRHNPSKNKKPKSIRSPQSVEEINAEAVRRLDERRKDSARENAYLFGKPQRLKDEPEDNVVTTKLINRTPRYY